MEPHLLYNIQRVRNWGHKTVWDCKSLECSKTSPKHHQNKTIITIILLSKPESITVATVSTALTSYETIKSLGRSHSCESDNGMICRLIPKTNTESSAHTVRVLGGGGSTKYNFSFGNKSVQQKKQQQKLLLMKLPKAKPAKINNWTSLS